RPARPPRARRRPCWPVGPGCWYPPSAPLLVQAFAADRLIGKGHAAVGRRREQAPLPLIPRLDPRRRGEEALAQGIKGQDLGRHALLVGQLAQGGRKLGRKSDHHCRSSFLAALPRPYYAPWKEEPRPKRLRRRLVRRASEGRQTPSITTAD